MWRILFFLAISSEAWATDWSQWMGAQRDGVWDETNLIETFSQGGPKVLWRTRIGPGYTGPSVVGEKVFVMDRKAGPKSPEGTPGVERLVCLEAGNGKVIWQKQWDAFYSIDYSNGPRATPTVHEGLVFALGAEGHLACFNADSGEVVWKRELKTDFQCTAPTWGFAGHPLIYKDSLVCLVGGSGSTCVALDRKTGREKWRALSSGQAGYCPPTLIENAGQPVLILWHADAINAIDPDTGKVYWTIPRTTLYGVSMAGPRARADQLLVSGFWWGCKMLKMKPDNSAPEVLWETEKESDRRTTHLNALMCTPVVVDDHFYGVCSYGQLRCLDWMTGERKWETFAATTGGKEQRWANAFLTRIGRTGNRFIIFNEKGDLIFATLTPLGYQETGRAHVIEPDNHDCGRPVVWSHPAYANGKAFVRNDSEIICVELAKSAAESRGR
ncbi:MAG: PQQ-binding-like beta-propeller repeat protein [Verrucomicrobiales bacterium]